MTTDFMHHRIASLEEIVIDALPHGELVRKNAECVFHAEDCRLKTEYYTACSIDGFIATDDDSLEWLFQLGEISETSYPDFIRDIGALAMGSTTYEWLLRHFAAEGQDAAANWPAGRGVFTAALTAMGGEALASELPAKGNPL